MGKSTRHQVISDFEPNRTSGFLLKKESQLVPCMGRNIQMDISLLVVRLLQRMLVAIHHICLFLHRHVTSLFPVFLPQVVVAMGLALAHF